MFMALPSPRRKALPPVAPKGSRRARPHLEREGAGRPLSDRGPSDPFGRPGCGGPAHSGGRSSRDARREAGYGPFGPRPRRWSSPGSRARGTRAGAEHCSASRSAGRAVRTDRRARGDPPRTRAGPVRRGRRPVLGRCGPSRRFDGRVGRPVSRLRLLAYRTIDRREGDDGSAPGAVLAAGGRRDRSARAGGERGQVGYGRSSSGVEVRSHRWGRREGTRGHSRWWRDDGRRGGRWGGGARRRRGRRDALGRFDLGKGVATFGAEERPVRAELATVQAHRHRRGARLMACIFPRH